MKKNLIRLLLAGMMAGLVSCSSPAEKTGDFGEFTVHRGTNIAHFLSQSDRRGAEREAFFTRADVQLIDSLGFDHIRLPIDEEQMWDEQMVRHDDAFELMHNVIRWAGEEGLRVIVDLHILRSHHFNEGEKPLWTDPAEQERFFDLWRDLSSELSEYPNGQVAYELMNEAVADDPAQWNELIAKASKILNDLEPERTIVVGSNRWQGYETFADLEVPASDTNILLSFHYYHPFALTHYRASWTDIYAYEGPVRYPGQIVREEDLAGSSEALKEQMSWAAKYFTADTMRKQMEIPLAYARERGLPLYCGEFGVYKPAPREDALRWYDDMIRTMESLGIAWANWCYKGSFGIFLENGEVDQELMEIFFREVE